MQIKSCYFQAENPPAAFHCIWNKSKLLTVAYTMCPHPSLWIFVALFPSAPLAPLPQLHGWEPLHPMFLSLDPFAASAVLAPGFSTMWWHYQWGLLWPPNLNHHPLSLSLSHRWLLSSPALGQLGLKQILKQSYVCTGISGEQPLRRNRKNDYWVGPGGVIRPQCRSDKVSARRLGCPEQRLPLSGVLNRAEMARPCTTSGSKGWNHQFKSWGSREWEDKSQTWGKYLQKAPLMKDYCPKQTKSS